MDLLRSLNNRVHQDIPQELKNLSFSEIEFLDSVISRAGPTATTFLTIFKAYNDVLSDSHIDPHETLYYGKLLKLGTLKGASWHEKWSTVKSVSERTPQPTSHIVPLSSFDYVEDTEIGSLLLKPDEVSDFTTEETPQYHQTFSSLAHRKNTTRIPKYPPSTPPKSVHRIKKSGRSLAPSQPPSYRSTDAESDLSLDYTRSPPSIPRKHVVPTTQKHGINEDEAWKKIQASRDEADAVLFRDAKLMERCWDVWRQSFLWIQRTNEQILEARNNLLVRITFEQWQERVVASNQMSARVLATFHHRIFRKVIAHWKLRVRLRKQVQWRESMRQKVRLLRASKDQRLQRDAWQMWRQQWESHLLERHFSRRMTTKYLHRWINRVNDLQKMASRADNALQDKSVDKAVECWDTWRRSVRLREAETNFQHKIHHRILRSSLSFWLQRREETELANSYHRSILLKNIYQLWKLQLIRTKKLEQRADKHLAKQNHLLLIAVARIWKSKERGRLLERVRRRRIIKSSLHKWRSRLQGVQSLQVLAHEFSQQSGTQLVTAAVRVWKGTYTSHTNSLQFAAQFHQTRLLSRVMLDLRRRYWKVTRQSKKARQAAVLLAKRRAFHIWLERFHNLQLDRKLLDWNRDRALKVFEEWHKRTRLHRWYRYAEGQILRRNELRLVASALTRWTNRVIEIKLRELEVSQRLDTALLRTSFQKWRTVCARHAEELRLMESYQIIKQNETVRRLFYGWLNGARTARYRRTTLSKLELKKRQRTLQFAWEKWVERSQDEKLRPLEAAFLLQTQRNMLFHAYGTWYNQTKSIPAIRLHTSNLKQKVWSKWVKVIPRALQTKSAKERDIFNVQGLFFRTWVHRYRTRTAHRAITRARHLRLPTSRSRAKIIPRPFPEWRGDGKEKTKQVPWTKVKDKREESPTRWTAGATSVRSTSPARSHISAPAWISRGGSNKAGPSSGNGDVPNGRSRLWMELEEVKRGKGGGSEDLRR